MAANKAKRVFEAKLKNGNTIIFTKDDNKDRYRTTDKKHVFKFNDIDYVTMKQINNA